MCYGREQACSVLARGWLGGGEGQQTSSHSPQAGRGAPMFGFLGDQFEGAKPVDVPKGREERGECWVRASQSFSASLSRFTGTPDSTWFPF